MTQTRQKMKLTGPFQNNGALGCKIVSANNPVLKRFKARLKQESNASEVKGLVSGDEES